jgi:hypothetical protein
MGIGPFRRVPENPVLAPIQESVFRCPVKKEVVHWESRNTVASAAAVQHDHVYLLYRAEPEAALNSRLGPSRRRPPNRISRQQSFSVTGLPFTRAFPYHTVRERLSGCTDLLW